MMKKEIEKLEKLRSKTDNPELKKAVAKKLSALKDNKIVEK